ncbi:lysine-specific demethylase 3B isoform X2 [Coccinella septempunctata]|uniref:lysine-specific demethylase 3B isoform X2 n=1 Tax=Coccinella septempunctata TaxID=41139 RepID=UPI001D095AA6|nr:lysine-specific demethylase 3B isoform X2 [Coccinella septempunctata]
MDVPDTRYPDDRSDSGLSSLRSGSGDERCGSRSSALSSTDDVANTHLVLGRSNRSPFNRSPLFVLGQQDYNASSSRSPLNHQHNRATAPVWRDPSLAEPPQVRHVDSVQHQSLLLMSSHQGSPTSSGPPATSSVPTASLYPPPSMISPHPRPLHSHLAPNMYAPAHHIPDMLWKAPYNLPSSHLLAAAASQQQQQQNAHHGEEMMEREQQRMMQERHNERIASSIRERQIETREIEKLKEREKERAEREKQEKMEREREEKERQEQALHNHFEKSLRQAAQQKREQWNPITGRPSQPQRSSSAEEDKKRAEQEMRDQRQHLSSRQDPNKDNRFYANVQQRVPSMTGKVDYPPPAHSSRAPAMKQQQDKMTNMQHAVGQKNDLTMFSYSPYHPQSAFGFSHDAKGKDLHKTSGNVGLLAKSASPIDRDNLPNPPPLISEMKNSVIVKHDGKNPHHMEPRVSIAHSPSPKLMSHYMPLPPQTSKGNMYEYRSPTQSPHHHLAHTSPHHMEAQTMAAKTTHHRQISSPHHHRQSPHAPQHSSPEMRYRSTPEAQTIIYPTPGKANYQFLATTAGYSHHTTNVSNSKPKVSSPAPHHIYGKPTAGILSGLPPNPRGGEQGAAALQIMSSKPPMPLSISPSPFQQASQYHPPPPQVSTQLNCPPPAHRTVPYDRIYPGTTIPSGLPPKPSIHGTSPPTASAAPSGIPRTHPQYMPNVTLPSGMPGSPSMQMQPLDLGMSSSSKQQQHHHDNNVPSPKRKGTPVHMDRSDSPSVDAKKRKLEPPPVSSPQVLYSMVGGQPLLARVDEPTPLIASEATAITTVANAFETTAPSPRNVATPPNPVALTENLPDLSVTPVEVSARPGSADSGLQSAQQTTNNEVSPVVAAATSAAAAAQPAASYCATATGKESPTASMKTAITPNSIDSEKSNSPGPTKSSGSYPVRHLKKAWLQRHTGEDMEDTTGIVGSGSCVTLPINISTSNNNKDPPVNTLHAIGSMAVNSISKPKHLTNKSNNRKGVMKEGTLNGHPSDLTKGDDSSSSDQERGRKSPPKRKPPKVKRKKGGGAHKKPVEEKKRKASTPTVASESGSDSDKDTASEKDSDSGASTTISVKKGNNSKEPRKRGRRPKISKGGKSSDEPRSKKAKEDVLPQRDPFRKPPVTQLKKTGESFLQDGPCFEVAPKLAKCRECRWTPNQRSKNMPNIFCRFYAFRRLRYTKNGQLAIAGFSDPHKNSLEDDIKLWLPNPENPPSDLDLETSKFLLKQVGDHFCDLLVQEKNAVNEHLSDDKTVAWKRVVQGVREMCDVCETTLFNFHWACGKCGFVVCLDCYKGRKNGTLKIWGETGKDRDEYSWLLCTNRQAHEQEKLMLTQIIADNCLLRLGKMVHEVRELWNIEQYCDCPMSKEVKSNNLKSKDIIKNIMSENMNGSSKTSTEDVKPAVKTEENEEGEEDNNPSPLSWFSDMLKKDEPPEKTVKKEKPEEGVKEKNEDASSEDDDNNFSTLRELLIRPSHKQNGSRAGSPTVAQAAKTAKRTSLKLDNLDEVLTSVIEESSPKEDEVAEEEDKCELKHFVRRRRYNWQVKGRVSLPIRIMTMTESKILYPNVPHSWLCDGKLLRLIDPTHKENYKIFQDQWKRGQPVIVSDVDRLLNKDLWNPDSFARDFGEDKNDLINCMTGNLVPNQPMKKFWEGFDHFEKRLKDDRGNPMLLKLKDWPPGEDFAEMLPTRFQDLMEVLPLGEYTHRNGRLNLASRLPDCFVRPDLGPKMYNAYGSALHPSKGTTNLHLDISDAVNVMVYVGIPKDGDSDEHIKEAFRAIDEAGCDILTRRRVRDKGELPGALWHIYNAKDADKIRDLLNKVVMEKGGRLEPNHDPIHDQSCYLDGPLRERLYKEYGVEGYAIVQCLGDAVFIPAGAPHQVRNLHNCIKVAEDFVSPENVSHCFHLTQEFRDLSDTHSNHEDKLQIKNIIYHAVKDSLSTLNSILNQHVVKIESESSESNGVSSIEAQKKEVSVDEAGTDV